MRSCGDLDHQIEGSVVSNYPRFDLDPLDIFQNEFCNWKLLPEKGKALFARFQIYYSSEVESVSVTCQNCTGENSLTPRSGELIEIENAQAIEIQYLSEFAQSYTRFRITWTYLGQEVPHWSEDYPSPGLDVSLIVTL